MDKDDKYYLSNKNLVGIHCKFFTLDHISVNFYKTDINSDQDPNMSGN